jgi:predicted lipoprotein with Yx(FWY)xxD motif
MRNRWWAAPVLAGAAVVLAACGSSASPSNNAATSAPATGSSATGSPTSSTAAQSGLTIGTRKTSIGTVLVNAQGKTLYWFAIDTATTSKCTGTCATYWPPAIGTPKAAPGSNLTMKFGTINRSGGQLQATYDGHPLYTYAGDTSAGMASGNGKNLSGGLWWAMTPSGSKLSSAAAAPKASASTSSAGGGYGY